MEGKEGRIREVLVTGPFGSDADGDFVFVEILGGHADDLRPRSHVALDDGDIARVAHPGAGDGKPEVIGFGDEDDRLAEVFDDGEFVEDREVVVDEDHGGAVGNLSKARAVDLDAEHAQYDRGGLADDPLGKAVGLVDVIGILLDEEGRHVKGDDPDGKGREVEGDEQGRDGEKPPEVLPPIA